MPVKEEELEQTPLAKDFKKYATHFLKDNDGTYFELEDVMRHFAEEEEIEEITSRDYAVAGNILDRMVSQDDLKRVYSFEKKANLYKFRT